MSYHPIRLNNKAMPIDRIHRKRRMATIRKHISSSTSRSKESSTRPSAIEIKARKKKKPEIIIVTLAHGVRLKCPTPRIIIGMGIICNK